MKYEKIMKQLKSFNFTDAQRKKLASIILKLDKEKQDILVSGDNIATINGQSLLNGGNISLIKTGIFTIVTELPTNDIDKDKVYLVPSTETDNENKFSEYIYTDNGWEKLGTFTAKIDLSNYVQYTDVVTDTTNGLMLASDKAKLDAFEEAEQYTKATNLPDSVISNVDTSHNSDGINLKYTKDNLIDGNSSEVILQIPIAKPNKTHGLLSLGDAGKIASLPYNIIHTINIDQRDAEHVNINWQYNTISGASSGYGQRISHVTTSTAGVMSASDKVKLDSLVKYKAGNGIDITGNTISCTLDTSLYSIVTELPETGLPNKIYLLPSTKTEEGNIYTEYGYVDNKWEELGKYKADIDLSPYSRALKLPNHILGTDTSDSLIKIFKDGEDLELRFTNKNLSTGIEFSELCTIPLVSNTTNGLISPSDKAKLDSQPTIKASDATGVTDNDYVVIKKSELDSILSRLSALENKA